MQTINISSLLDKKFVGADDLRKQLTSILTRLPKEGGELVITQHGTPQAVLMDVESYLELQEQLADTNPELIKEINAAVADVKTGHGIPAERVFKNLGL